MFSNYIKVAIRNLIRNKSISLVHLIGLSIGIMTTVVLALFIKTELSFENYQPDLQRTYHIYWHNEDQSTNYASTPLVLGKVLRDEYPQIEKLAQISIDEDMRLIQSGDIAKASQFYFADPELFEILSFDVAPSIVKQFANNINSVLISKSESQKLFGDKNPAGEILTFKSSENEFNLMVEGVFQDTPINTHIRPNYIANMKLFTNILPEVFLDHWGFNNPLTLVKLKAGIDANDFSEQIELVRQKNSSNKDAYFGIIPLDDVHLFSTYVTGFYGQRGDVSKTYIYAIIAILTLLIACVNFINLHTAKSVTRAREIGVRKVVGASKNQVVKQILTESFLITLISTITALVGIYFLLPIFNQIFDRNLNINYIFNLSSLSLLFGLVIFIAIFSGSYSAAMLSKMSPVKIFKGNFKLTNTGSFLRRGLITFQFVIFTGLLICSYIIFLQIDHLTSSNPGYSKDQLVSVTLPDHQYSTQTASFAEELKKFSGIANTSITSFIPPSFGNSLTTEVPNQVDKTKLIPINLVFADHYFSETIGIDLSSGSYLSINDSSSQLNNILLNEAAVFELGLESKQGQTIEWDDNIYTLKGIVKDFRLHSGYSPIEPLMIINKRKYLDRIAIKLTGSNIKGSMDFIKSKWEDFFPNSLMEYSFQDEEFERIYKDDKQFANLIYLFTILSVFIAIMGLSGIIAFTTQQKVKEIGIRKVLGASSTQLLRLLSKEIFYITVGSFIIVAPLSYYLMDEWLSGFAQRVVISPFIFIVAVFTTMLIALVTVFSRVATVVKKNPVESLRHE